MCKWAYVKIAENLEVQEGSYDPELSQKTPTNVTTNHCSIAGNQYISFYWHHT